MSRNRKRFIATASAAVAVAALALTGAAASMAGTHVSSPTTLKLRLHGGSITLVNVMPTKAIGVGDEVILAQPVFAAAHPSQAVGHGYITVTFLTKSVSHDAVTLDLKRGDIELAGISVGNPFTLAVTGGTGMYQNARGQAIIKTSPGNDNPASVTVTLLPQRGHDSLPCERSALRRGAPLDRSAEPDLAS